MDNLTPSCPSCDNPLSIGAAFCAVCGAPTPPSAAAEDPTQALVQNELRENLSERYRLERKIGRGGMALVYLAHDLKHDRRVALKVLHPQLAAALGKGRFLREIQIAAKLNHPHILPLHDSGEAGSFVYYVMPYVEGESLRNLLRREQQLPIDDALRIARALADALGYAHSLGVVHRDVKPENVLLSEGHAVLADFGIARAISFAGRDSLTATGASVGTPHYMSPEQASGSEAIDGRSDIYSLGCVLYEMLAGEPPFTGANPQAIVARHLSEQPPSIRVVRPSVPSDVEAVIEKSLEKIPADRFDTAAQFAQHLARLGQAEVVVTGREVTRARSLPIRAAIILLGIGLVGIVSVVAVRSLILRGPGHPPIETPGVVGLAVFPFRAGQHDVVEWSEALPDFLATALDGTSGIRVSDPWSLWRSLRPAPDARARSPDPEEAARLASRTGATQFVLGSIVRDAEDLSLNIRMYSIDRTEAVYSAAFRAPLGNVLAVTQELAAQIITSVLKSDTTVLAPPLELFATTSADALKAYLDARGAMRRGLTGDANSLIDRSLSLDSTFGLALVEATVIKSWVQFIEGRLVPDLLALAERAVAHSESLGERNRQRARTVLASIRTDGEAAAEASERILQHDSTDLEAWASLAYSHQAYGWQYAKGLQDAIVAAERVVQLDSTYVPGLVVRAELAAASMDSSDMLSQLARLQLADTTNALVHGAIFGLRSLLDEDAAFATTCAQLVNAPLQVWMVGYRMVRAVNPGRAEILAQLLEQARPSGASHSSAVRARALLLLTRGRFQAVDSMIGAGVFQNRDFDWTLERIMVAASVAGLVRPTAVINAVRSLTSSVPIDSAIEYLESRPVLRTGWVLAAYNATHGDTTVAKRWNSIFGAFPPGGPQRDYRRSIQLDIESRLAERAGDLDRALHLAQQAYDLWTIHSPNALEDQPEPAMRSHLASLLRHNSQDGAAASVFRSLAPPVTWLGFYTALAWLELGELAERRGDLESAVSSFRLAQAIWEHGDSDLSTLSDRATAGMRRATAPH